jgi:hypothetical protein
VTRVAATLALTACIAFSQSDRGTLTGTITDPAGALVPGADMVLTNPATGISVRTVSTEAGNYAFGNLSAGQYDVTVERQGFRRFEQKGIGVQVARTVRVDIIMQLGSTSESITVAADASMLKTESAEQATTLNGESINALPINFGIGAGAIRNPLSFVQLAPGATMSGWNTVRVNGSTAGSFRVIFEGQDSSSQLDARVSDETQASVEAIGEFTIHASNFSAEFGQVFGGLFNFTSKSGTNQLHGSAYDYMVNEALGAGIPFTDNGRREHVRPAKKLHDFGFSIGGPVYLPKVYNGKNRTFFFVNWEKYRDRQNSYLGMGTVPTDALRQGDFGGILTGRNLGTDPAGRAILENTIYDPSSRVVNAAGQHILLPFTGNIIPRSRIDPTAQKLLDTLPKPAVNALVNNYELRAASRKIQQIPSVKIDHSFNSMSRISGYWSTMRTDKDNNVDGYPDPLSVRRDQQIRSTTVRINYDQSLTPTLLLHLGAGVQRYWNPDSAPPSITEYDPAQLGIRNAPGLGFPRIAGIGSSVWGGMAQSATIAGTGFNWFGPGSRSLFSQVKPTGVAQATWVRNRHTYKAGGDWKIETFSNISELGLSPYYTFSNSQTAQPLYGGTLPGGTTIGHGFASFLLGQYGSASIGNKSAPQYRKSSWAFFVQDTFKVTRRLTLDYGLRWDLQKPMRELWHRTSTFQQDVVNPNANGLRGGVLYEGTGSGRCNCDLVSTYPYAIGPRLGIAYQLTPTTVLRAGWGITYGSSAVFGYISNGNSQGMGFNTVNFASPGNNEAAGILSQALAYDPRALYGASYDPGLLVTPGASVIGSPANIDPNGGRPPRISQWNVTLQRALTKNLSLEGAYVGNRSAYINNGSLINYNAVSPEALKARGIDITKADDRTLLSSNITSPAAVARGFQKPYANYPNTGSVIQSLKPFPQYSSVGSMWTPLGNTWYDALQIKAAQRTWRGLEFTASYAFSKNLNSWAGAGNIYDRKTFKTLEGSDLPHLATISINYMLPTQGLIASNKATKLLLGGWTVGGVMQYASGALLATPGSSNNIGSYIPGQTDRQCRVSGEPLFLIDPNSSFDPTQQTLLNPKAWADAPAGFRGCQQAFFGDFRGQRRPSESMSMGKRFNFKERVALSFRVEFFNVFNRMVSLPNPSTSNPQTAPTRSNGVLTGGFGFVAFTQISTNNINNAYPAPRSGQFVIRIDF